MKSKIKTLGLAFVAIASLSSSSEAAVIFTIANFTGSTGSNNGLPIVNDAGAAIAAGGAFAWIGKFSATADFNTMAATELVTLFTHADPGMTPVGITGTRPGLFNGQDYNSAGNVYPAGFVGETGYILVTNTNTIAAATAIAVFSLGTTFSAPAPDLTASYTIQLTSAETSLRYGVITPVTVQPKNDATPSTFVNGVALQSVAIPEPSTMLLGALGALGLLRRRR